jgi:hypothetical protein
LLSLSNSGPFTPPPDDIIAGAKKMGDDIMESMPDWAKDMWKEIGSPKLDSLGPVLNGNLLARRHGLRKDDLLEVLLDARLLPEGRDPWMKGRLISSGKMTIELLCEDGRLHYVSRDAIIEVILIAHMRPAYLDDTDLMTYERDDLKRRSKLNEKVEKEGVGRDDSHLWG